LSVWVRRLGGLIYEYGVILLTSLSSYAVNYLTQFHLAAVVNV